MKSALMRSLAAFGLTLSFAVPAYSADLLVLTDDVPAGLDFDGPTSSTIQSYTGIVNLLDPLVYFQHGQVDNEGVQLLDFQQFEGRLAESWSFDEATLTWTLNLRRGVKGCDGRTFDADDVIYTYARAKTVSGSAPIGVDGGYGVQLSYLSSEKGGILNSMNYENDMVDAKFFEMLVEGDVSKRNALLVEIQDQLMADVAVVPVVEFKTNWAISDQVKGVTWHPDNSIHWYDYSPAN